MVQISVQYLDLSMMFRPLIILITCFACGTIIYAQDEAEYFVTESYEGQYFVIGNRFPIAIPEDPCFESLEDTQVFVGKRFIIVQVVDEMENWRGPLIFNKEGDQINYDLVQREREKHYQYSRCCVYVEELDGKLYFWDVTADFDDKEDYDCYLDSQTDTTDGYIIPRYYIFDYESASVETKVLKNKCSELIRDGTLNCD